MTAHKIIHGAGVTECVLWCRVTYFLCFAAVGEIQKNDNLAPNVT